MIVEKFVAPASKIASRRLIVGIYEDQTVAPRALRGAAIEPMITRLLAAKELSGGVGEVTTLLGVEGISADGLVLVGLGARPKFDNGAAFAAGVAATKRIAGKQRDVVALAVPEGPDEERAELTSDALRALVEGVIVGTRGPGLCKKEPSRHAFGRLEVVIDPASGMSLDSAHAAVEQARIVGEAVNLARELTNLPPREKTPRLLAERARAAASEVGLSVEVWDQARIEAERFGGLLGVAAGSDEPPAFVVIERKCGAPDGPTFALVGKGVTFDSGGLSLKPSSSMEDMKSDMTGAAVVLATMVAAARLSLHVNVVGYLAITENMTGGSAVKLGDVLTMRDGTTVEIMNTDAEGRLILADALAYAAERKPARIIDLATLTGACMVALGSKVAGLFSNDEHFATDVASAARRAGERVWRMPLDADYKELLKSNVADLKNVGGKYAGAVTAAKFLEVFVGETPWAHLDIAGPSWSDGDSAAQDPGGTVCFVRTLVALLMEKAGREGRGY